MFQISIENLMNLDAPEFFPCIEKFDFSDFYSDNYNGSIFDDSSFN
jgi:hypothetical protein